MLTIFLICLILGVFVGTLAGLLGIGGGLIIVPVLLFLLPLYLHIDISLAVPMAIASSLASIILTGLSSTLAHYKLGNLSHRIALWCSLGVLAGAALGSQIVVTIAAQKVTAIFAILVLVIAAQLVFGKAVQSKQDIAPWILIVIGFVTGTVSAFMGIGGGAILVPALIWFRVDIKIAIGCAAFCGLVIGLIGTTSFIVNGFAMQSLPDGALGFVYLPATAGIVITSVFTARLGAKISHRLNTRVLKQIFAGFLVIVSLRMLLG